MLLAAENTGEEGMEPVLGLGGVTLIMINSFFKVVHIRTAQIKDQEKNSAHSSSKARLKRLLFLT